MMQDQNPVACADEISTGLDAAVTHDIVHSIVAFAKAAQTTRVVSLLQPGPETFCLFDEVILLAKGYVIYAGPISEVVDYFSALGYKQVSTIDVADFLQLIPTPDGAMLFDPASSPVDEHYTAEGFAEAFQQSEQFKKITAALEAPSRYDWTKHKTSGSKQSRNGVPNEFKIKYQNSFFRTMTLNLSRHFTLWKRDKAFIYGKLFENIGMAIATGGILFGSGKITWDANTPIDQAYADDLNQFSAGIYGALFMTTFHILLGENENLLQNSLFLFYETLTILHIFSPGTMTSAPDEIDGRSIHYKHCDANFYQTFAFVFGRLISTIPQVLITLKVTKNSIGYIH
jgi:ABC-2 type transporter